MNIRLSPLVLCVSLAGLNFYAFAVFTNYASGQGLSASYDYDLAGQLRQVTRGNGNCRILSYDAAGQVTTVAEWWTNGTSKLYQSVFVPDAGGRLTNEVRLPAPRSYTPSGFTAGYNPDNEISGMTNGGAVTVRYDLNGNMRTNGSQVMSYDGRNRLTQTANGGQTVSYGYDPAGQRISVTVNTTNQTKWTVSMGKALVREKPGGTKTYYIYGLGLLAQYEETNSIPFKWHHYDYQGSTVALTDAAGKLCDRFEYGPYGELSFRAGITDTPFQYHGAHGVQADTNGLMQMGARYYSAQLCRFLTADPAGFSGGINFYEFAAGNPISFVDPSGLGPQEVGFGWIQRNLEPIRALQDDARIYGTPGGPITGASVVSGTLNMIPLVSSAKAFVELNTGRDLITGQRNDRSDFSLASQAILGAIILPPARAAGALGGAVGAAASSQAGRRVFYVTPAGVAVSSETLALQGTSRSVGNFTGLAGASVDEIISRVPANWTWGPQDRGAGIKFKDSLGIERVRIHGPSFRAPAGANASVGWVLRVSDASRRYYDNLGRIGAWNANETHIPILGNPNSP